jgi:glycosyltransferase involved in cell wall biosynthesis
MSFFSLHHILSAFTSIKGFDIIVANCQYSAFAARAIKRKFKTPYVLQMWDPAVFTARKIYKGRLKWYPLLYLMAKWLDNYAFKECSAIITSGKYHHEYLRKVTDKPLEILYPGCFIGSPKKRERIVLTYDRWDIGNTPKILDMIKYLDAHLIIGGFWHPKELKDKFQEEVKSKGLSSRVTLLGVLNEDNIMELCSKAMVHVHLVHEAFGMSSLEAAACGCPIIIPYGSGVTDLFKDGVHGYFPKDNIIRYLKQILDDPKKAEQMGKRALNIAKKYDWDAYAKTLERIVKKYRR